MAEPRKGHKRGGKIVPVIDLFAGPGGLSFGFASHSQGDVRFDVRLSIEKDKIAHRTLLLRAFLRQFEDVPSEYYRYIRGEIDRSALEKAFPKEWNAAGGEAVQWTLGEEPFENVSGAIAKSLNGAKEWILLGGPPCQAYSLAGRSRMRGFQNFSKDERHTLYREYLRIVAVHQPPLFVMENVKGILSSTHGSRVKGGPIIQQILADLRSPVAAVAADRDLRDRLPPHSNGYSIYSFVERALFPEALEPQQFVIRSEDWGVPQRRHRVILLGIRNDVESIPCLLGDLNLRNELVRIEDVIDDLPRIRSELSGKSHSPKEWASAIQKVASKAVVDKVAEPAVRKVIDSSASELSKELTPGGKFIARASKPRKLAAWLYDRRLGGVIQHSARSHMAADLMRYFFAACAAKVTGRSPTLEDFPPSLLPTHSGVSESSIETVHFGDRFRVQIKGKPSTTITSHISKDGHYYIHYDPTQCRSLTVREAARLQTFPDSYFFEGGRTQQYHQVGNAVPPLLALKLAAVVAVAMRRVDLRKRKSGANSATSAPTHV